MTDPDYEKHFEGWVNHEYWRHPPEEKCSQCLEEEIEELRKGVCPHLQTSVEGTSYCTLAEGSVRQLGKENAELRLQLERALLLLDSIGQDVIEYLGGRNMELIRRKHAGKSDRVRQGD